MKSVMKTVLLRSYKFYLGRPRESFQKVNIRERVTSHVRRCVLVLPPQNMYSEEEKKSP